MLKVLKLEFRYLEYMHIQSYGVLERVVSNTAYYFVRVKQFVCKMFLLNLCLY